MWKIIPHSEYGIPKPYEVKGTTMTVPNLAPTLVELISASTLGSPLPLTSTPLYDNDENSGLARVGVASLPMSEVYSQGSALSEAEESPKPPKTTEPANEAEE